MQRSETKLKAWDWKKEDRVRLLSTEKWVTEESDQEYCLHRDTPLQLDLLDFLGEGLELLQLI